MSSFLILSRRETLKILLKQLISKTLSFRFNSSVSQCPSCGAVSTVSYALILVKWRRFIVPKKVEQINDYLFIDTRKSNNIKIGVNDVTANDSEMCVR